MIDTLNPFIEQVTTLKGPSLLVVFLIMLGYALKMFRQFENRGIPFVNFTVGALLCPLIVAWPTPGSMEPDLRFPELAAWISSTINGFLLACIAWVTHTKFLRKFIDDKIPAMNPGRTEEKTKTVEVTSDQEGEKKTTKEEKVTVDIAPSTKTDAPAGGAQQPVNP